LDAGVVKEVEVGQEEDKDNKEEDANWFLSLSK
jgi:hypothetical protein